MSWIDKVWTLLLLPDPTIIAALLGVLGAVIAGVLGGWLGGRLSVKAALEGAQRAHADNVKREQRALQGQLVGFVQAIQAEVEGLFIAFETQAAPAIRATEADVGVRTFLSFSRDYFIAYPANAGMLGHINDLQLRKQIVKVYIAMRAMIDAIHTNNRYLDRFERTMSIWPLRGPLPQEAQYHEQMIVRHGKSMKSVLGNMMSEIEGFYTASNGWLVARGMKSNPPPQFGQPEGIPPPS
jgi:hypothetical protein